MSGYVCPPVCSPAGACCRDSLCLAECAPPGPPDPDTHHHHPPLPLAGNNVGCNCVAAKVVLLDSSWPLAQDFLSELRKALQQYKLPPPYYPGIKDRWEEGVAFWRQGRMAASHVCRGASPRGC